MEFYEEHMEQLHLREWLRLYSPRIVLGFLIWFLFKIRLARMDASISPVKGDIRERLIELHQVPEQAQPEVVAILQQLAEQGFVDPLIESQLHGRNRDHLKMIGVNVLSRHKSGRYVALVTKMFEGEPTSRQGETVYTFIDKEKTIMTSNMGPGFADSPENELTSYPESTFEKLLEHHRQTLARRGDSFISIHHQDEMLTCIQGLYDRFVARMVQRGYFVKIEPEEGPELPPIIDYENQATVEDRRLSLSARLIFIFFFLAVISFLILKKAIWGP
ncbi:hypothetical protein Pan153_37580 [Gimesia panareensis]|uniref:Uncharacterized protein n=1 Tax=Gimesia panareensis TaxID=2527978 RepID=A0A518FS09_9PLAN|nr:hypothetical protein [Gimesia panareensis]QDV19095.1 hypothetical protein Pan153_37580 [Gimesia panareensis]